MHDRNARCTRLARTRSWGWPRWWSRRADHGQGAWDGCCPRRINCRRARRATARVRDLCQRSTSDGGPLALLRGALGRRSRTCIQTQSARDAHAQTRTVLQEQQSCAGRLEHAHHVTVTRTECARLVAALLLPDPRSCPSASRAATRAFFNAGRSSARSGCGSAGLTVVTPAFSSRSGRPCTCARSADTLASFVSSSRNAKGIFLAWPFTNLHTWCLRRRRVIMCSPSLLQAIQIPAQIHSTSTCLPV